MELTLCTICTTLDLNIPGQSLVFFSLQLKKSRGGKQKYYLFSMTMLSKTLLLRLNRLELNKAYGTYQSKVAGYFIVYILYDVNFCFLYK